MLFTMYIQIQIHIQIHIQIQIHMGMILSLFVNICKLCDLMEMQHMFGFYLKMFGHKQAPSLSAPKSKPKNNQFYLWQSQQVMEL